MKLAYPGHILMENRHRLVVCARVRQASGMAERDVAIDPVDALGRGNGSGWARTRTTMPGISFCS